MSITATDCVDDTNEIKSNINWKRTCYDTNPKS